MFDRPAGQSDGGWRRPRVTFVVHRYGNQISGGAEQYCRRIARRMQAYWDLEIVTTCARDYLTWANAFAPGEEVLDGVRVLRFPVPAPRDMESFQRSLESVLAGGGLDEQEQLMYAQGPCSPSLFEYLRTTYAQREMFVFFSYLYAHTYFGLPLVAAKSALVPMAHDEPTLKLEIYRSVFDRAGCLLFLSPEERRLVRSRFQLTEKEDLVVGIGCEPVSFGNDRFREEEAPLPKPYGLYIGRVDVSKGMGDFFHYFTRSGTTLNLVVVGDAQMEVPADSRIRYLGFVSEEAKRKLLRNAEVLFLPSAYESLSLSVLEAWQAGIPVLVNGKAAVLEGHCDRSGGGLAYQSREEFEQALSCMMESRSRRAQMGLLGRRYVDQTCSWTAVERQYHRALDLVGSESILHK